MRWWPLPACLVCFAAGYLLGTHAAPPEPGRAPRRETPAFPEAPPAQTAAPESREAAGSVPAEVAVAAPDPESEPQDPEPDLGQLVVDFAGFDGPAYVRLEAPNVEGELDYEEQAADENGFVTCDLNPGEVLVRWESAGGLRRYAARARIEAGRVTRLRAADPCHGPLPEPAGLAILDVRVLGADGSPVPDVTLYLEGRPLVGTYAIRADTESRGRARLRAAAGEYVLEAGQRKERVSLGEGERKTLELRHEAWGEIAVDATLEGEYSVHLHDQPDSAGPLRITGKHRAPIHFPFLAPGAYDLRYCFLDGELRMNCAWPAARVLATFEVQAGRASHFAHDPGPGFLDVRVNAPEPVAQHRWELRIYLEKDRAHATRYDLAVEGDALGARVGPIPKGRYAVEVLADGAFLIRKDAMVAYGSTSLVITVTR